MRLKKIEKTRLRRLLRKIEKIRLRRQDWKNKIEKTRLKKQDWRTSSSILSILSIFLNLHQSEKYNKLSINKLKNINRWNIIF